MLVGARIFAPETVTVATVIMHANKAVISFVIAVTCKFVVLTELGALN